MSIQREIYWLDEKKKILQFLLENDFELKEQDESITTYRRLYGKESKIDSIMIYNKINPEERNGFSGFLYRGKEYFRFSQIRSNYFDLMFNGAIELLSAKIYNDYFLSNGCFSFIEDDFCTRVSFISGFYYKGINIYDKRDSRHKMLLKVHNISSSKEEIKNVLKDKVEIIFFDEIKPEDIFPKFVAGDRDKDTFRKESVFDVIERLK